MKPIVQRGELFEDLMAVQFEPSMQILGPWLFEGCLVLLYAPRGIGKTFFSLQVAHAIASGSKFLKWKAEKPRKVVLFDGEMGRKSLQRRLAQLEADSPLSAQLGMLRIHSFEHCGPDQVMWNLADPEEQKRYLEVIGDADVVIIDNLKTCARKLKGARFDSEEDQWDRIQAMAIKLRSAGKAVLFVHHANKGGLQQSGTQQRENIMNTVVALKPPADASEEIFSGARFELLFEKSRDFFGKDTEPLYVTYEHLEDGRGVWSWDTLREQRVRAATELLTNGARRSEIVAKVGAFALRDAETRTEKQREMFNGGDDDVF